MKKEEITTQLKLEAINRIRQLYTPNYYRGRIFEVLSLSRTRDEDVQRIIQELEGDLKINHEKEKSSS